MTEHVSTQEPLFSGIFLNTSGYMLNFPDLVPREKLEPGEKKDFKRKHSQEELESSDYIARYIEKGYIKPIDTMKPSSIEAVPEKQIDKTQTRDIGLKTATKKLQRDGLDDGEKLTKPVKQEGSTVVQGTVDTDDRDLPDPDAHATQVESGEGGATVITQKHDEGELQQPAKPEVRQAGDVSVISAPEDDVELEKTASAEEGVSDNCSSKNRFGDDCAKIPPKGYSHCVNHMPDEVKIVYKKEKAKAKKKIAGRKARKKSGK